MYTGPKDWGLYTTLSSTKAYEKLMQNNVDMELSCNSWDITILKTLNTSKSAIFADSAFLDWGQKFSKHAKDLPCMVRLSKMLKNEFLNVIIQKSIFGESWSNFLLYNFALIYF